MNIKEFINDLLNKSNNYDTEKYLEKWNKNAVLDDPSVGKVFEGHAGIKKYFVGGEIEVIKLPTDSKSFMNLYNNNSSHTYYDATQLKNLFNTYIAIASRFD